MGEWIKWLNPSAPITSEADARSAARASAISIFVGVLWGIFGLVWMMTVGKEAIDAALQAGMAQAAADASSPEEAKMAAGMMGAMGGIMVGTAAFMIIIQAVIGFVQWRWPNIVVPIIFTILVVYGLGSSALALMMQGNPEVAAAAAGTPLWITVAGIVIMVVQLLWHITAIRGASELSKFMTGVNA